MIDISKRSPLKYLLFASLYFSEGIIYGLAVIILPAALQDQGMDISLATLLIGISWAPWLVKFFWGGIIDYFQKYGRKKFIIIGGFVGALSYFLVTFVDPILFPIPFVLLLTVGHTGVVFLDVSADAWAIEISKPEERGKINASMFAGLFIGSAVGSIIFGYIINNIGFYLIFPTAALMIILIIMYPLAVKEKIITKIKDKVERVLFNEFKIKNVQLISIFSTVSTISYGLLSVVVPLYLKIEFQRNLFEVGLYSSGGLIGTIIGAIIGGFIADSWGRKKSLYTFFTINIILAAGLIFSNSWEMVAILFTFIGIVHGGAYSAHGAILMDFTNPRVAGTQYSIYTSLANVGEMGGNSVSGYLISVLGFGRVFLYSAWLYGPALLVLYLIRYRKNSKIK